MSKQKRLLAVHDVSCFGRCSLTVALPIISATGIETVVLPTAILSTHTGGFTGYTYRDLTDDIVPIIKHWEELNIKFDAVYSGFLGSFEQIDIVSQIFKKFKAEGSIIAVDPVMADNGELYKIFDENFPKGMVSLCQLADVIMPNITEASLMLSGQYKEGPYTKEYIRELLIKLSQLGPKKVVLTGVYFDERDLGAASFDALTQEFSFARANRISGYYHGTGDVFGSALVAALVKNKKLSKAVEIAVDFTVGSIKRTYESQTDIRFGVNFEEGLGDLLNACNSNN
ncbi:MAG: pyridoxamine kinase [Christensenellaceae bacterium]|jgi:pyridoxine kinase|nr:pyridoxamine kinase [Christensenellaceae bacterium]